MGGTAAVPGETPALFSLPRLLQHFRLRLSGHKEHLEFAIKIKRLDSGAAITALPQLLARDEPARIRQIARTLARLGSIGPLSPAEKLALAQMLNVFDVVAKNYAAATWQRRL